MQEIKKAQEKFTGEGEYRIIVGKAEKVIRNDKKSKVLSSKEVFTCKK